MEEAAAEDLEDLTEAREAAQTRVEEAEAALGKAKEHQSSVKDAYDKAKKISHVVDEIVGYVDKAVEYVNLTDAVAALAGNITLDWFRSDIEGCNTCRRNGE